MNETLTIGIDVGGTKIAAALVSFPSGELRAKQIIPTLPQRGGEIVLEDTLNLVHRLKEEVVRFGKNISGIGIGLPELISLDGKITSDYIMGWRDLPALEKFSEIAPTRFESDSRAPAVAESIFGAGKNYRNFVYLTVGTGISHCLVLGGKPYAGAHGHAIIAGSGRLTAKCPSCGFEHSQVLEEFAAGPSLVARYNKEAKTAFTKAQQVTEAAAAGDALAEKIVKSAAASLGNSAGFLVNVLDPEAIIVGGGLGLSGGLYWERFIASTRQHIWSEISQSLPILPAALGTDAGIIGAAASIWKSEAQSS
jgi:glucokinase